MRPVAAELRLVVAVGQKDLPLAGGVTLDPGLFHPGIAAGRLLEVQNRAVHGAQPCRKAVELDPDLRARFLAGG